MLGSRGVEFVMEASLLRYVASPHKSRPLNAPSAACAEVGGRRVVTVLFVYRGLTETRRAGILCGG